MSFESLSEDENRQPETFDTMFSSISGFLSEVRDQVTEEEPVKKPLTPEESIAQAQYSKQFCLLNLRPDLIEETDRRELVEQTPARLVAWKEMVESGANAHARYVGQEEETVLQKGARLVSVITFRDIVRVAREEQQSLFKNAALFGFETPAYKKIMVTVRYWLKVEEITQEIAEKEES